MKTDELVREFARSAWDATLGAGKNHREMNEYFRDLPPLAAVSDEDMHYYRVLGCACATWAHGGYLTLETSSKLAAALACTPIDEDLIDTDGPPTALLRIPHGITDRYNMCLAYFTWVTTEERWDRSDYSDKELWYFLNLFSTDSREIGFMWFGRASEALDPSESIDEDNKLRSFCARIVVGLMLTMKQSPQFVNERWVKGKRRLDGRDPPKHRLAVVGRPVSVDIRARVRDFVSGRSSHVSAFQYVVRGHWKRQVVGALRSGRKIIWVEPYWRGPEDAPILARPYRVGGRTA